MTDSTPVEPVEPDEHDRLMRLGELLERKDDLTDMLRRVDSVRGEARTLAGLPDATDDDDTEEQTLLRVGLLELDAELDTVGVFDA